MAAAVATSASIVVDTIELAGFANKVGVMGSCTPKERTNFASNGWQIFEPGLLTAMFTVEGFQDWATTGVDPAIPASGFGATSVVTVSVPGTAAGDTAYIIGQAVQTDLTPVDMAIGELAAFKFGATSNGRSVRGSLLHPVAARTASGTGTAVAFTAPTSTQSLYAAFNVLSVTGAGTLTLKVQTDDNGGFTTPADRITSSAFAAVGKQYASLAGALPGETHVRTTWTVAGFTSVTFAVSVGVAAT